MQTISFKGKEKQVATLMGAIVLLILGYTTLHHSYHRGSVTRAIVKNSRGFKAPDPIMYSGEQPSAEAKNKCDVFNQNFDACIDKRANDGDGYLKFHARRYKINFHSLCPRMVDAGWEDSTIERSVLELGATSQFTQCMNEAFKKTGHSVKFETWGNYKKDLREPFDELKDATYDLVICQEVIEHISDRNTNLLQGEVDAGAFTATGIKNAVSETYRVLKPGGLFMVTTPNINSHQQVLYTLIGIHTFSNLHHVREMSRVDVEDYLTSYGKFVGFNCEFHNTWRPQGPGPDEAEIESLMTRLSDLLVQQLANQPLERIAVDMNRFPRNIDLGSVPRQDNAFYYVTKPK